jgi:hypothetical protein
VKNLSKAGVGLSKLHWDASLMAEKSVVLFEKSRRFSGKRLFDADLVLD